VGAGAAQAFLPQLQFRAAGGRDGRCDRSVSGPQHSFALADVFQYLKPNTVEHLLVQAMLDAPMFQSRWRWNATRALAVLRSRGGKKVPTPLQRMEAEDLSAAVFPDQLACPENLVGDREIPNHPLVNQTVHDCLTEAMDLAGLLRVLEAMDRGELKLEARDTTEPSPSLTRSSMPSRMRSSMTHRSRSGAPRR